MTSLENGIKLSDTSEIGKLQKNVEIEGDKTHDIDGYCGMF